MSLIKRGGVNGFWKKRFLKVYLPYFIVLLVSSIFEWTSCEDFVKQVFLLNCRYWFISYIVVCYILYWVISVVFPKIRLWIFSVLSLLSLILLPELQAEQSLSFFSGLLISHARHDDRLCNCFDKLSVYWCIACLGIGIFALMIKQYPEVRSLQGTIIYNIIQMCIKLPLAIFILLGLKYVWNYVANAFIAFSGKISYELYLVHFPLYGYGKDLYIAIFLLLLSFLLGNYFNKLNVVIGKRLS